MAGNTIWTINKLITWTTHYFKDHHIESPRLDAEILLAHVLNKSRIYLYTNFDLIVNPDELAMYRVHVTIKKIIQLIDAHIDSVIGNTSLREIICTDSFGAVS